MTRLYKPVLIETAEQAEALPIGTVAHRPDEVNEDYVLVASKVEDDGAWQRADLIDDLGWDEDMIGWTALVPIEAEVETSVVVNDSGFRDNVAHPYSEASMDSDGNVWFGEGLNRVDVTDRFNEWAKQHTLTRLVTPWEALTSVK